MKKILLLSVFCVWRAAALMSQPQHNVSIPFSNETPPKREVRAVWLATIGGLDWPHCYARGTTDAISAQKKELTGIFDKLQKAGINTVLLQTRVRGTTIYPSVFEPWDACLSGTAGISPGYDALAFAIEECHKRGMELHAWVVTIPVGKWNGKGCAELRKKYPSLIKKIGDEGYMNPEDVKTADYIANICEEITKFYDIDGIHLDYIRYPENWKMKVPKERGRQYITDIVRQINIRVKSQKPWVKISCSPIGKADDLPRQHSHGWNAYSRVCQDAQGWLKAGLMDFLFPMMYFKGDNFYPFALDWQEQSFGRVVVPGLGIYFMSPSEQNWSLETITQEMEVARNWGMGHAFFRCKFLTDNMKGIYSFVSGNFDHTYALVPAMTWERDMPPLPPQTILTDSTASTLSWGGATDRSNGPYLTYNIYCSKRYPVDVTDPANLVMARTGKTSIRVPLNGKFYAVTAMDRYGNESDAVQNANITIKPANQAGRLPSNANIPLFECDGKRLKTGVIQVNNSDLLQIETLQGTAVKAVFYSKNIDVGDVPEGFYLLRSIGKKKTSHLLGFFKIERTRRK